MMGASKSELTYTKTTMSNKDSYRNERIVGHGITAWREENSPGPVMRVLQSEIDLDPLFPEYIVIEENDVDWEKGQTVRLTPRELKEIYEHIFGEDE